MHVLTPLVVPLCVCVWSSHCAGAQQLHGRSPEGEDEREGGQRVRAHVQQGQTH